MFSNIVTMVVLLLSVVALVYTIIAGFGLYKAVKAKATSSTIEVEKIKKIKAKGDADANAILNNSLTDNVLKQKYIDALKGADNLTVVPNGSVPMIQTGK